MKKKHALLIGVISLLGIFYSTLFIAPEAITTIGPAVVAGVLMACGFYQGANVADNWQRSKYYQSELDRKGNP